jgi:hypothetical protein
MKDDIKAIEKDEGQHNATDGDNQNGLFHSAS